MADAKPGVHVVQLKPIVVPEILIKGNKFIMFNDNSTIGTPVTLKVDKAGHILYWKDQNKEMDFLDISLIKDTRTGSSIKTPKDHKLKESLMIGQMDVPLEDKMVTIVYGTDMVSQEYVNFVCAHKETAQEWADEILSYAVNLLALNSCALTYLEKLFARFSLVLNSEGKVSMRNIVKQVASNKEDRRKVEKALEVAGFHAGKTDAINPQKFTFENFFNFYRHLLGRTEVDKIFDELGAKKKPYLTTQQFCNFLNKQQRDPRLNEILYPNFTLGQAESLLQRYESRVGMAQKEKGHLSQEGFLKFLLSDDNNLVPPEKLDLSEDMDQPLAHYFINSSHNTYLAGHQFTGKSTVEMYHLVLLSGCRCIELDCWDGKDSDMEPVITHGYTMCTEVLFKDVIEAIAQSAFKTSEFPVILSFENHCSPKQQAKMANYCRTIFGDMLLDNALESNPLKPDIPLPSPNQLKKKIIVKNKKKHFHREKTSRKIKAQNMSKRLKNKPSNTAGDATVKPRLTEVEEGVEVEGGVQPAAAAAAAEGEATVPDLQPPESPGEGKSLPQTPQSPKSPKSPAEGKSPPPTPQSPKSPGESKSPPETPQSPTAEPSSPTPSEQAEPKSPTRTVLEKNLSMSSEMTDTTEAPRDGEDFDSESESSDSDDDDEETTEEDKEKKKKQKKILTEEEKKRRQRMKRDKGTAGKEASAAMEMSLLVNYIQPVHFHSFEASDKRKRSYEITSFVESQGMSMLKESPVEFVNYNKRQMSRIYPRGTRVDSSNFMPQVFWNAGCQLVALNFQTLDLAMQINMGIFEYNGRSGYILKPDFMRRKDRHFDPFAESTVDGIIAGTVSVKIISGQFLTDKKVGTYVEVDMYGLPTDTVRKKFRTKIVPNNGINPVYDEEPFVFKKVVLPNLATVRIAVYEDQNKSLIGHRVLPVEGLRPGYRHIPLRNECNLPLMMTTLFVHITVKDYVPDFLAEIADGLYNPIAYQNHLEKHAQQLEILMQDFDVEEKEEVPVAEEVAEEKGEKGAEPTTGLKTSVSQMQMDVGVGDGGGNNRQNSVTSRSTNVSMTLDGKPAYPRTASLTHIPVSKQGSSQSATSQGSGSSATSIPIPMTRMQSGLLVGENGTPTSFIQTTKLSDPTILVPTPLAELKTVKSFQKALARRDKELDNVRRKHEKAREVMEENHQMLLDKLMSCQLKTRISMEKTHSKTLKKNAKGGNNTDQLQNQLKGEMQELLTIQDLKHREMKSTHAKSLMKLCKEQHDTELEIQMRHHEIIYDILEKLMEDTHASHVKALDEIHDREVVDLKKQMDAQSRSHMKMLGKKHKDKQELSRIKREAQQKHVQTAVTEREKLKDLLGKRQHELQNKLEEIRKEYKRERESALKSITDENKESLERLEEELASQIGDEDINDDFTTPEKNSEPSDALNTSTNSKTIMNGEAENGTAVKEEMNSNPEVTINGMSSPDSVGEIPNKVNSNEHLTSL